MDFPGYDMDRRSVVALVVALLVLAVAGVSAINGHAKDRAMTQEEAYLEAELSNASCIESYGTFETTDQKRASVIGYHSDGVTVRVQHPYWYGTDDVEADALSEAVYVVSSDTVRLERRTPLDLPC